MNDRDYIRKAVELADGWEVGTKGVTLPNGRSRLFDDPLLGAMSLEQYWLDALAAQLVRQVDAAGWCFVITQEISEILAGEKTHFHEGPDRTLNTIKAIVDSGVLDPAGCECDMEDTHHMNGCPELEVLE